MAQRRAQRRKNRVQIMVFSAFSYQVLAISSQLSAISHGLLAHRVFSWELRADRFIHTSAPSWDRPSRVAHTCRLLACMRSQHSVHREHGVILQKIKSPTGPRPVAGFLNQFAGNQRQVIETVEMFLPGHPVILLPLKAAYERKERVRLRYRYAYGPTAGALRVHAGVGRTHPAPLDARTSPRALCASFWYVNT